MANEIMSETEVPKVTFKGKDLGYTALPPPPTYGSLWMNNDSRIIKAYNADGEWVTYDETNDTTLKEILSLWVDFPIEALRENK